jgi:undecaprenyl diphosphate synthase
MHVAIIMDGNGRWAGSRNLNRQAGHRAGARAVDAIVRAAARQRVGTLTLYAFSADNWQRPCPEVQALFGLLRRYLITETDRCVSESIRLNVIGRRDRLPAELIRQIERSEQLTAASQGMHLRLAVDYSSRYSIMEAAQRLRGVPLSSETDFLGLLAAADHSLPAAPTVDLLIRTGGEHRLSDFLLWECAYAELLFVDCPWPDFDAPAFAQALAVYGGRQRRFGRIPEPPPDSALQAHEQG